jgi:hypothetical protein
VGKRKYVLLSYLEASELVSRLGFATYKEYCLRYKEYPGLPSNPKRTYGEEYLGFEAYKNNIYPTYGEASNAVIRLGIDSGSQYRKRYIEDPRLPEFPDLVYGDMFKGMQSFTGKTEQPFYPTMREASDAVIKLGCKTPGEYAIRHKEDSLLPSSPSLFYADEWHGWPYFLKIRKHINGKGKYGSYDEFVAAVRQLGITSILEYKARYKEDARLPSTPENIYLTEWKGWRLVLIAKPKQYSSWREAREAVLKYRFGYKSEYEGGCFVDERLPKYPAVKYKDFPGWRDFLMPDKYECLDDVRCAVKLLRIKNSIDYKDARKKFPNLPSHPERMFSKEWIDWYELCCIPYFYSYDELQILVRENKCTRIIDYRSLIVKLKDRRIPKNPDQVYEQWVSWYVFLGRPEPHTLDYIRGVGVGWIPSIKQFLKTQRAQAGKEKTLCYFVRDFIEPYILFKTPREFLTTKGVDIRPFKKLIASQKNRQKGRSILLAVNAFFNYVLIKELTIVDEDTGELVRVDGANNPFATLEYDGDGTPGPRESTKPALAFQYVDAMKKWMVPEAARTLSDLSSLHQFDGDYIEVDEALIDRTDPDCVFKTQGDKFLLWYPGYWMHAYALVSIPARGRQIAYNDSGESDEYVVDIEDDKFAWVVNKNPLSHRKNQKAFIYQCDDGWGMHFTSNKTSYLGQGYDVPWAPEKLIYWMIRLRKWQEKYNPIKRAMPWSECTRTNLNETQLKRKGANCFLFRAFGQEEPPTFASRLSHRLAAALYFTQPKNLILAVFSKDGNQKSLGHYRTKYTPHSMRVSLITAYVMEFGLPIEVIMKLAGHASIIMSIYYVKLGNAFLRRRMDEGEKLAMRDQAYAAQDMLEQNRIEELTHQLIASNEQGLQVLRDGNIGSILVRDYGLCPYAAARCEDGGHLIGGTQVWHAVPAGFLGMQNCIRCRHFITGPMFLAGMLALWNAISFELNSLSNTYLDFEKEIENCLERIQVLDELEYDQEQNGIAFDCRDRNRTELEIRKLQSEKESIAKKMDMLFCDLQALTKQINECKKLIMLQPSKDEDQVQLVLHDQSEVSVEIEQTSMFQQLNEVCVNASIFQSVSASSATPRRSQMIDRVALFNNIRPSMCYLNETEQLAIGNQFTKFLLQRLKTWARVNQLVDCQIMLEDLGSDERISKSELAELMSPKTPQLLNLKELML